MAREVHDCASVSAIDFALPVCDPYSTSTRLPEEDM